MLTFSALVLALNVGHPEQSRNVGHSTQVGSVTGWTERGQKGAVLLLLTSCSSPWLPVAKLKLPPECHPGSEIAAVPGEKN